jgi:hypothetical protein
MHQINISWNSHKIREFSDVSFPDAWSSTRGGGVPYIYDTIFFGLSLLKVVFLHSLTWNILETLPLRVLDPKKLEKKKKLKSNGKENREWKMEGVRVAKWKLIREGKEDWKLYSYEETKWRKNWAWQHPALLWSMLSTRFVSAVTCIQRRHDHFFRLKINENSV